MTTRLTDPSTVERVNNNIGIALDSREDEAKAIKGFIFGSGCEYPMAINVPPLPHIGIPHTIDDLDIAVWVTRTLTTAIRAECINDRAIKIDHFPCDSKIPLLATYTIMCSQNPGSNKCIQHLSREKLSWFGDIIVLKQKEASNNDVVDMQESDIALIIAIVLS
ncbi:hypothetical protein GALMADRAFT_142206 [Galerina marginata CBS 339.88]|uniref:Uncharacterized protein n=1 Tax=Galerina marginata (strain CBS 339.88) TaxID=685588 RepID=A0A067SS18_GALM3|nr:hypothetical protein GALMADRAFT_142206 [Galerina marginata CBS 339.88]